MNFITSFYLLDFFPYTIGLCLYQKVVIKRDGFALDFLNGISTFVGYLKLKLSL